MDLTPSLSAHGPIDPGDSPSGDDAIDLRESFRALRRHLGLIVLVAGAIAGATWYFAHRTYPIYQSDAVIRIVDNRRAMTAGIDNQSAEAQVLGRTVDPILSQIQVLESRAVAAEVVRRHPFGLRLVAQDPPNLTLTDVTVDSGLTRDTLSLEFGDSTFTLRDRAGTAQARYGSPVSLGGTRFTLPARPKHQTARLAVVSTEMAVERLTRSLHAEPRKTTDVIDVTYTDNNPLVAQEIVNVSVNTFQELNADQAQERSRRRRVFVGEQLAQTDSILRQAQEALSNFASEKQVYGSDQVIAAQQSGLLDLDVRRGELSSDRHVFQALYDSLQHASGPHATEALNAVVAASGMREQNPVVATLYQQLVLYETARDSLTIGPWTRAPGSPDVKRLDVLIATTKQRLTDATRSQIDAMSARIEALDSLKARTAEALQKLPATQAAEARLVEQLNAARTVADALREEYQKARIDEAVEAGQVEIVDSAVLPRIPISRGPLFKTLLGLIIGLMAGIGAAFVAENLNTAIHRREEIETVLRVPGLAIIPQIMPGKGGLSRSLTAASSGKAVAFNTRSASLVATDLRSIGAEAFRTLRTNLVFSQAVQSLRVVAVTSSVPGEGKTTTSANLAVTFAQQGMRVVLVDGDLRRPQVHEVFAQAREPGLTHALVGRSTIGDVIRKTSIEELHIIPAGALPPNPAELLGGARMKEVLEYLRERYDVVIIDTPPVHAAADALVLGRAADGVLIVVRAGRTDREAAQDAMRSLAGVGARVVGAVLNDPDHKTAGHGGYYYYEYYGSAEDRPETITS